MDIKNDDSAIIGFHSERSEESGIKPFNINNGIFTSHRLVKNENNICYLNIFGNKIFLVLLLISSTILLSSCDTCGPGNPDNDVNNDIYFTAIPLNSNTFSIFAISQQGNRLREVLKDAIIYSSPSANNKLVFLRPQLGIDTIIATCNTSGDSISEFLQPVKIKRSPVISPDGANIAVYTGNKELWLVYSINLVQTPSYNFCENTEPSFSPDGGYLAFYEGDNLNSQLTLKIIHTTNPISTVLEKKFNTGINPYNGLATISWAKDGSYILYVITDSTGTDVIHGTKLNGDDVFALNISGIGAVNPDISPDDSTVVFATRNGKVYRRPVSSNLYFLLADADSSFEYYLYPKWTHDGANVYFTRYDKTIANTLFKGTLEIVNIATKRITVLGDNAFRGFQISK